MESAIHRRYVLVVKFEADTLAGIKDAVKSLEEVGFRPDTNLEKYKELYCGGNEFHYNAKMTVDEAVTSDSYIAARAKEAA